MKAIVNLTYKGDLVDAHMVEIVGRKGRMGLVQIDITQAVDDKLKAFTEQREKKQSRSPGERSTS